MDIIGVGESGVDLLLAIHQMPGKGEKVRAREIGKYPGGMIGNFCSAAGRLGAKCGVVSAIGDDDNGNLLIDDYRKNGIDISHLIIEEGGTTFYCVVFLDETGEKYLTTIDTPLAIPPVDQIDLEYLGTAQYVHMNSMNKELVEVVAKGLSGSPVRISLDYEAHADQPGLPGWQNIFAAVDILFINEEGAASLLGDDPARHIRELQQKGPRLVVMTCGEKGGVVCDGRNTYSYSAYNAGKVIDTTGAGDCFNASFLYSIINGKDIEEAARYAAAAAAISITEAGARTGQPTGLQVEDFLKKIRS